MNPSDRAGFLQAILADPADDTPRLVYADGLRESSDEFDQAHGRFLAAGLQLHHTPQPEEGNEGPYFEALKEQSEVALRVLTVQASHLLGWAPDEWGWDNDALAPGRITAARLPAPVFGESWTARRARRRAPEPRPAVIWERGCVTALRLSLATWATHGSWVFHQCPLERIELTEVPGLVLTVVRDPVAVAGWRMGAELKVPPVIGPPSASVVLRPALRFHRFCPTYEQNADGLTRDRAEANMWDWADVLMQYLRQDAGEHWPGPAEWNDPDPAEVFRGRAQAPPENPAAGDA